ncbi:hypothetical protein Tco_0366794 [Tanacetum coccineum]
MEVASLTQQENIIHFYTLLDMHGVPPNDALVKVAMLGPVPTLEFIGPWGTSGDPGLPIMKRARILAKRDLRKCATLGVIGGERFFFNPFGYIQRPEYIFSVPLEDGKGLIKSMPQCQRFRQTWIEF